MKRTLLSTQGIALPTPHLSSAATACKRLLWLLSLLLVPVLSMAQAPAIDGDPSDWPAVFSNAGITVKNFTEDSVNSSDDDIFTNGSADVDLLSDWAWTQSGANDKNDIHSAGIAHIGTRVYFFADRFSNNGDAAIGIWIFKNNVSKMAGGSFSGAHVNGDILLISHFVNGGTVSDRKAFVWTNGVLVEDTTLTLADFAVAVNSTSIAAPAAWGYVPKTGPAGTYPENSFFEGYIDLASANLSLDICFSSFVIETRNSQSLNASLEDLVTGTFTNKPLSQTTSGSTLCSNSPTGIITMDGSEVDVSYQLKNAGNNSNVQPAQAGTGAAMMWTGLPAGSYYIVATNIGSNCETIMGNPTVVILNAVPATPGITGAARCGPGIVTLAASGGANCDSLIWFSDAGLTTRVNAGPTFSPNISGTTSYWVICKSAAGCTSGAAVVTGTVNPLPATPTTTGASRCGTGTVALSAGGGANCDSLIWFSDAGLTTRVNVGPGFSPNISSTTTYWVICKSVNGCVSAATTVTGTLNPIPAAPTTTGASRCGAGIVALSASGSANCDSLIWFSDAGLTTRVNVGPAFSPNISGTTTYWVVCKSVNGCAGAAATVTGTVNPVPAAPTTTGASRCGPGMVILNASGGANCDSLIWFSDAGLTNRINTGANLTPALSGTTTYWVVCKSANGCMSAAATVVGTINPVPAAPTTTGASRCGAGTVVLGANGGANCDSLIWFSNAGLTTRVNVGPSFSPNVSSTTTYWVICKSAAGCAGNAATVTATVNPAPAAPLVPNVSRCGPGVLPIAASGGTNCDSLIWFSDAGLTTRVNVDTSFSPNLNGTTTYWVICKSAAGCSSSATAVVASILVCGNTHCTYTQGYYGNTNGNSCDGDTTWPNPVALINHLLTTDLVIGSGGKSILIPAGSGVTVNAVMPGGKTPKALVFAGQCTISTANGSCFKNNYLTPQGRINNVLLSQTIALALNARIHSGDLLGVPIDHGYLTTQETAGCGDSSEIVACTPVDTLVIGHFLMNENVVNYLTNFDAQPATVADLLQLANDVLGGALMPGQPGANGNTVPAYADVNAAVDAINRGFDECRAYLGYNLPLCPVPLPRMVGGTAGGELSVYPNPGDGHFTVELPGASEEVKATVLDMNGRVVYEKAWKGTTDGLKLAPDNLATGVYLLQIQTGIETYRTKIMIRR